MEVIELSKLGPLWAFISALCTQLECREYKICIENAAEIENGVRWAHSCMNELTDIRLGMGRFL